MREAGQGDLIEYCYQIRLLDPSYQADIIEGLTRHSGSPGAESPAARTTVEL